MSRRLRKLKVIERRWIARFGEPPSLLTDPLLMQRILDEPVPPPRAREAGLAEAEA